MKPTQIKFIFIIILLAAAGIISWQSFFKEYAQEDTVSIHAFPKEFSSWSSEEQKITDEEYKILETKNAFSRIYKSTPDKEIMLFIVYSQHNRKISHPPELCYAGSGLTLVNHIVENIALQNSNFKVNRLLFDYGKSSYKQIVYYWFKVGNSYTNNYWKQQLLIAIKSLFHQNSSSALIRLSAVVREGKEEEADKNIKDFAIEILPYVKKYLP